MSFVNVSNASSSADGFNWTGLGLNISYRIVGKMHKVDISYSSKPDDTKFNFDYILPWLAARI